MKGQLSVYIVIIAIIGLFLLYTQFNFILNPASLSIGYSSASRTAPNGISQLASILGATPGQNCDPGSYKNCFEYTSSYDTASSTVKLKTTHDAQLDIEKSCFYPLGTTYPGTRPCLAVPVLIKYSCVGDKVYVLNDAIDWKLCSANENSITCPYTELSTVGTYVVTNVPKWGIGKTNIVCVKHVTDGSNWVWSGVQTDFYLQPGYPAVSISGVQTSKLQCNNNNNCIYIQDTNIIQPPQALMQQDVLSSITSFFVGIVDMFRRLIGL